MSAHDAGSEGGAQSGIGGTGGVAVEAGTGAAGSSSGGASPTTSLGTVQIAFYGGPRNFCKGACAPKIEIRDETGNEMHPTGDCVGADCPACGFASCNTDPCTGIPLSFSYAELTWDGSYDELVDCHDGTSCRAPHFATAGTYTARLCLAPGNEVADGPVPCVASGAIECTTVHFDYPRTTSVHANLGCVALDEACVATSDCCQSDAHCIGGFCAIPL
jgi:hypothetical protein